MLTDRPLDEDIEYAAQMVREGVASTEQAATACGIPLSTLEAHLSGWASTEAHSDSDNAEPFHGSGIRAESDQADAAEQSISDDEDAGSEARSLEQGATDYFVFHRDEGLWVWKRMDDTNTLVKASEHKFAFYLDCVADARPHGFTGRPLHLFAHGDLVYLNEGSSST